MSIPSLFHFALPRFHAHKKVQFQAIFGSIRLKSDVYIATVKGFSEGNDSSLPVNSFHLLAYTYGHTSTYRGIYKCLQRVFSHFISTPLSLTAEEYLTTRMATLSDGCDMTEFGHWHLDIVPTIQTNYSICIINIIWSFPLKPGLSYTDH